MSRFAVLALAVGGLSFASLAAADGMHGQGQMMHDEGAMMHDQSGMHDESGMHAAESGHGHEAETPYGVPGTVGAKGRRIEIVLSENDQGMFYAPDHVEVARGSEVRFDLRNEGVLEHEFVIGTAETNRHHAQEMEADPDMTHADPNAARLQPGGTKTLAWRFTEPGTFEYACLIPGHREAGMLGRIVVK